MRAKPDWQFFVSLAVLSGVVAVGVAAMVLSEDEPTGETTVRNVPDYYLRAESFEARFVTAGDDTQVMVFESWRAGGRWRWDSYFKGDEASGRDVVVVDGRDLLSYQSHPATYYEEEVPEDYFGSPFFLGFLPHESIEEFVALQAMSEGYEGWSPVETSTILGRTVEGIEVRLDFSESFPFADEDPDLAKVVLTFWIERETMLALGFDLD